MTDPTTFVVLLRGINVAGKNKILMADLRTLAENLGFVEPQTYIQSGNLVISSDRRPAEIESDFEAGLREEMGLDVPVIARTAARWSALADENPFPEAIVERAKFLHFAASKRPPAADAAERLQPFATAGERLTIVEDGLWIDFNGSVGRSKLTPNVLDRCVGSVVTARNWKTILAVTALASA